MNSSSTSDLSSPAGLHDIHRLISECHVVLEKDPSCLHARAVRGHACMKAKLWDQAVKDFSVILHYRPDDVHGRFSRGMALFKSGRVDDAHKDFSKLLELNPNHVMARYALAGCYNSEGEFNQAIQEYTLALQHDEKENAAGFRAEKRRIGMHENAEYIIRKTMGGCARFRSASVDPTSSESRSEGTVSRPPFPVQEPNVQNVRLRSGSVPEKRPKKVVQVRVSLNEFTTAAPQSRTAFSAVPPQIPQSAVDSVVSSHPEISRTTNSSIQNQVQETQQVPQVLAVRAIPKTVRRVTVAL